MEVEKKNGKGIIVLVVVLILIIFSLIVYICIDKFYSNNNNKNDTVENIEDVNDKDNSNDNEDVSDIDDSNDNEDVSDKDNSNDNEDVSDIDDSNNKDNTIDSPIVTNAMEIINRIYISDNNLYSKNRYDISEISNYDLIATALANIDRSYIVSACSHEPKKTVTYEVLNSALNKYILNQTITEETVKSLNNGSSYPASQYEINNIGIKLKENGLELLGTCGEEFQGNDYINKKVVSAEKDDDYLYIYEKHAFARYSNPSIDNPLVNYYKDYNRTTLLEKDLDSIEFTDINGNPGKNSTPKWELYNTYKYTFKRIDNNYYLQSFELVNQ